MDIKGKIKVLSGMQEFKQFTEELVRVYHAARQKHMELEMPSLVLVTGSGRGNTTCLRLLTELIREEHLLALSGEEEVFEWQMLAEDKEAVLRLMIRMEQASGFYPYFSGVIGLDLSDYRNFEELPPNLFELIRENRQKCLFCLMITEKQASRFLKDLEEKLRTSTRVKTIRLTATEEEMSDHVRNEFLRRGFLLADGLEEAIQTFVKAEGGSGYRGLHLAIDEVIWQKMNRNDGLLIDAKDLTGDPREAGKWAGQKERKRMIGFGACEL